MLSKTYIYNINQCWQLTLNLKQLKLLCSTQYLLYQIYNIK